MKVGRAARGEEGLTLLELVVVTSILAVLSAIISLSVTGRSTEGRAAVQVADEATIQRAVDRFSGEHPQGRFPTLNGCPPDRILDLVSSECVVAGTEINPSQIDTNNLEFVLDEVVSGVDLNEDGDIEDSFNVAPIIWHKAFKTRIALSQQDVVRRFLGDYVPQPPKHAFDFLGGTDDVWEDGENFDPDNLGNIPIDPSIITAPSGLGAGANRINTSIGQVPVWVLGVFKPNSGLQVQNLLPEGRY